MVDPRVVMPTDLSAGLALSGRHEELLDDLERIALDEGFRHLTVQTLAERLRCSRRTLYELAPSKDELVLLVMDRLLRRMGRKAMSRIHDLDDPRERLLTYLQTTNGEIRRSSRQLWADVDALPSTRRLVDDHYRYAAAEVARLIRDGVEAGEFREDINAALIAEVLSSALRHFQDPQVLARLGSTNSESNDQVFELALYGVSKAPRPTRKAAARNAG